MRNQAELDTQRRITDAFIDTQPVDIVLTPRERTDTPAGGKKWTELEPRQSQKLRLIEPSSPPPPVRTADGIERQVEFILLGRYDAEIGVYDVFDHAGGRWEVVFIYHDNGWERRAGVARHG